jgi:hypothetical protein
VCDCSSGHWRWPACVPGLSETDRQCAHRCIREYTTLEDGADFTLLNCIAPIAQYEWEQSQSSDSVSDEHDSPSTMDEKHHSSTSSGSASPSNVSPRTSGSLILTQYFFALVGADMDVVCSTRSTLALDSIL